MTCKRCGRCCVDGAFSLETIRADDDPKEFGKWFAYHRCDVGVDNGVLRVTIPLSCVHLRFKDGKSICAIQETKPQLCKDYLCKLAKMEDLVNG